MAARPSRNEKKTENLMRALFAQHGYTSDPSVRVDEQKPDDESLKRLLKGKGKAGNGGAGYPEFIITSGLHPDLLIVVECKAAPEFHASVKFDKPVEYAVDGALHYARALAKQYNVIAIGASGETNAELKLDAYLVCKGASEANPLLNFADQPVRSLEQLAMMHAYGLIHTAAEVPVTIRSSAEEKSGFAIPRPPKPKEPGIGLDMGRVAALHAESEKVSALLGTIFAEDISALDPEPAPEPPEAESAVEDGVLGLDTEHTAFARLLWTRAQWARDELEELAQDRGILLDGAMERINEAAFDICDQPFCEGDDPVEINQELLKEISQ